MPGRFPNPLRRVYERLPQRVRMVIDWIVTVSFVAVVAIALFMLVLWLATQARGLVEGLLRERLVSGVTSADGFHGETLQVNAVPSGAQTPTPTVNEIPGTEEEKGPVVTTEGGNLVREGENLVVSSFTDLFSGVGWLDQDATTMYHERDLTAFTFPPLFEWGSGTRSGYRPPLTIEDGTVTSCLGGSCLVKDGTSLYVVPESNRTNFRSGTSVPLPDVVEKRRLSSVSVGALGTTWLVGTVERSDEGYVGRVFYLPAGAGSTALTPVFKNDAAPFRSQYVGTIGFGGSDDDFLVIYGAYEGLGYHVHGGTVTDVSRFFGIRVMENGFYPVAVRTGGDWYVYSATKGTPKFVKLFQNGTDEIVGGVDLTKELFSSNVDLATFAPTGERTLTAEVSYTSGEKAFFTFVDKGFDKSRARAVVSVNISNYPAEVVRAAIERIDADGYGGRSALYMKNSASGDWSAVKLGEVKSFADPHGRQLFWKMTFTPDENPFTSPYLDTLQLRYAVKFL